MAIEPRRRLNGTTGYRAKVKDPDGKWYDSTTFSQIEDARLEEAKLFDFRRKGMRSVSQDARAVTVDGYWEVWSVENRTDVSEGWKISQDQMYRDYVSPVIGPTTMIKVGKPEVGQVLTRMKVLGRGEQTRKHVYSMLRKMFGDAVEYYEMLAASPVSAKFHKPKVKKTKREFLEAEEAFHLLHSVRDSYLGPPTWLGMLSALRISEIQALRGHAVSFPREHILVCAAFNNKTGQFQDYPKQEDWAYSPMVPMLADYLKTLSTAPGAFVAPGVKGGMLPYETYLRALARACRKAGVKVITPHELRHSSTEIWVRAGASTEDIRRLLNHSNLSATMGYIHRTDSRLSEVGKGVSLRLIQGDESSPNSSPFGERQIITPEVGGVLVC
jgi:integrase